MTKSSDSIGSDRERDRESCYIGPFLRDYMKYFTDDTSKMSLTQKRLYILNAAWKQWKEQKDKFLWDIMATFVSEQKTKKKLEFRQLLRGVDPMGKKYSKAKEIIGGLVCNF